MKGMRAFYAGNAMIEMSVTSGTDQVMVACMMFVRALKRLKRRKRTRKWKVPAGLFSVQILPAHTMQFLSDIFVDPSLLDGGRRIRLTQWLYACQGRCNRLVNEMLSAVKCSTIKVALKRSGIFRPDTRRGSLAARSVGNGNISRYYYKNHLHEVLSSRGSRSRMYGTSILMVIRESFLQWAD